MDTLDKLKKRLATIDAKEEEREKKQELYDLENDVNELLSSLFERENIIRKDRVELAKSYGKQNPTKDIREKFMSFREESKAVRKDIKEIQDFKAELIEVIAKYRAYDKYNCLNNIDYLLEKQDKKVGQLESEAHVRVGYMSRIKRTGRSTEPSLQFVTSAAKMFNVTVDELLYAKMREGSETENYLIQFINKLIKDTREEKLSWNKESEDDLRNMSTDSNGDVEHPLFSFESFSETVESDYPEEVSRVVFKSNSFGVRSAIDGDCFNLRLKNGSYLYIMSCSKSFYYLDDPDAHSKELWMYVPSQKAEYLCSNANGELLGEYVDLLYEKVSESMKHPLIKENVKNVMDAFMNDDIKDDPIIIPEEDEDDSLPFNF